MESQRTPRNQTPEPLRGRLQQLRLALLRLHKALLDSERAAYERANGPITNSKLLQLLLEDPYFAWLRPYSGLIVVIDEALAGQAAVSEEAALDYAREARELIAVDEGDEPSVNHYDRVCRRDPDVLVLHVELSSRIREILGDAAPTD
jgi:hypothetical protein